VDLDDVLDPRTAVAVAVTTVLFSPRVRRIVRRGTIYSVAGLLVAGEVARSLPRRVQRNAGQGEDQLEDIVAQPQIDE
jgi:hypothetical protein